MSDLLMTLGGIAAMTLILYGAARLIGLGTCVRCGRPIPPWNAYCRRESCETGGSR